MQRPIYMDGHATTPCDPRVVAAMAPIWSEAFGNPASREHAYGWEAEALVERAREEVAALIGAEAKEIVFTSGGTEGDNLAIRGAMAAAGGGHLIVSAIEHKAVLTCAARLEREGVAVTRVGVGASGAIDPADIQNALRPDTRLVSVMLANNEIGTVQPAAEIGALCKGCGILFHSDAVQAGAYLEIDVDAIGADLLTLSAHKMYGPKGVGALYVRSRPRVRLAPLIEGGGHEGGLRSGTLNAPGVVGFGAAARIAQEERRADAARIAGLRDRLEQLLRAGCPAMRVTAEAQERLAGSLHVVFPGLHGVSIIGKLRGLAVSSGAACTSATAEPSHVLEAIGMEKGLAATAIRFGLHRFSTEKEVDGAGAIVIDAVRQASAS